MILTVEQSGFLGSFNFLELCHVQEEKHKKEPFLQPHQDISVWIVICTAIHLTSILSKGLCWLSIVGTLLLESYYRALKAARKHYPDWETQLWLVR